MTTRVEWVETLCSCGCGVTFRQLRDPGREREYLNNAHKQRAYRARNPHKNHSGTRTESAGARRRREEREAWARQEAAREEERQRSYKRRTGERWRSEGTPLWCYPKAGEPRDQAKRRRTTKLLYDRACHDATNEHEAEACRDRAEEMRTKYGL
jgi:hypothetical protein